MNPRSRKTWMYVILFLIGVGILYQFAINPRGMIIPLAVFGAVYLLYKFPPSRWRQFPSSRWRRDPGKFAGPRGEKMPGHSVRKAKFRVIRGNKKDGEPPRCQ